MGCRPVVQPIPRSRSPRAAIERLADAVLDRGWLFLYWCRDWSRPALHGAWGLAKWGACIAGLLVAATVVAPLVSDYRSYVITGDSMAGAFGRGTLVYEEEVPRSELAVGDVITYTPPRGEGPGGLVTHRIYSIDQDPKRGTVYVTKGDANRDPDPWRFTLEEATQPRVVAEVPYVGYAYAALSIRPVRLALIGLPALLLAFVVLRRMWRDAGEELRAAEDARLESAATSP